MFYVTDRYLSKNGTSLEKLSKKIKDFDIFYDSPFGPKFESFVSDVYDNYLDKNVKVESNDRSVLIKFDMPGVDPNTIETKFEPEKRILKVSGKVVNEYSLVDESTDKHSKIEYDVSISKKFDASKASICTFKNGILYIQFDVAEASKPQTYQVKIE